jgi:hypothetical protein
VPNRQIKVVDAGLLQPSCTYTEYVVFSRHAGRLVAVTALWAASDLPGIIVVKQI